MAGFSSQAQHGATVVGASATHVGRVREHNEDSLLVDADNQFFIVADGMGGHAAGEVASETAVRRVREWWISESMKRHRAAYAEHGGTGPRRSLLRAVRDAVLSAHFEILKQAQADSSKGGMGTTFTGFLVAGGEAAFAHAGDSRAYRIRDRIAMQLSEDHTVISRMKSLGAGPDGEEWGGDALNQWNGVLTNALGMGDSTRVATFVVPLYTGDIVILCSDGAYEYTDEAELAEVACSMPSPARVANRLVEQAVERGGHDNATVVVVKIVEAGETVVPVEQRKRDERAIVQCPLFAELSLPERLRALRITTEREQRAGKAVAGIALGSRVAHVVLEGEVRCAGKILQPGDLVYPDGLVGGTVFREDAGCEAATDVRLLTIRRDDFLELCEEESDLGVKLHAAVAKLLTA